VIKLPAEVGRGLFLLELGDVRAGAAFCAPHAMYPVGYRAVRMDAETGRHHLCEVLSTEDGLAPVFRTRLLDGTEVEADSIVTWQAAGPPSETLSIGEAWRAMVPKKAAAAEDVAARETLGAHLFGLCERTVQYHLQRHPHASACADLGYRWRDFSRAGDDVADAEAPCGAQDAMTRALDAHLGGATADPWTAPVHDMAIDHGWIAELGGKRKRRKGANWS
jgi:hypothetical protein